MGVGVGVVVGVGGSLSTGVRVGGASVGVWVGEAVAVAEGCGVKVDVDVAGTKANAGRAARKPAGCKQKTVNKPAAVSAAAAQAMIARLNSTLALCDNVTSRRTR